MSSVDSGELAAARAGDGAAFRRLTDGLRPELRVHCYRMLGSTHDADDAVQETWLRAWRRLSTYEGQATLRAWLYRIATNVCLDELERRPRRMLPVDYCAPSDPSAPFEPPLAEQVWLEPLPDAWIVGGSMGGALGPDARYSARQSVTLAFTAALQLLPAKQRAVLLLRDVLGLEAAEVSAQLELTVGSVNSALHRARTTLDARAGTVAPVSDESLSSLLARYVSAWESADVAALLTVIREDACLSMPPRAVWYRGHDAIARFVERNILPGGVRLVPCSANGQPGFAVYKREASGDYSPFGVSVLTVADGLISESITFIGAHYFTHFDLPAGLPAV